MNASPKQRFLEQSALAKQFLDVVDGEPFQRATELAMLGLVEQLADATDPSNAAANSYRIDGAKRFLALLKALPEPPKPVTPRPQYNIDHALK
jgi:hypothetical protein